MRILIALASIACACLAGCTSSEEDDLPVQPGAGGVSGGGKGGSTPGAITGRVCLVANPFALGTCADTGAGGLVVSLGGSTALTQANGAFSLAAPAGTGGSFTVAGPNIVTGSMPLSPANTIPVLSQEMFNEMLSGNSVTLQPGTGSVLATVVDRTGNPISGVTATSTPTSAFGPFFDSATGTQWTINQTGQAGIVFFPGVTVGPATLTFSDLGSTSETTVGGVQVIDGGLTIEEAVLP